MTSGLYIHSLFGKGEAPPGFILAVTIWLWLTLIFANFSEALAEGRGKAQAASLRRHRKDTVAKKLKSPQFGSAYVSISSKDLRKGDIVLVEAGDMIPMDGEVIEGIASVDESAITGESAPVIRESGGDRSAVTGGTKVLSDWLIIKITSSPGETFLDRMIAMVEGAKRKKTPNEIALSILLAGLNYYLSSCHGDLAALFYLQCDIVGKRNAGYRNRIGGVAGMSYSHNNRRTASGYRHCRYGQDDSGKYHCHIRPGGGSIRRYRYVLLLDKTGTITLGNRQAVSFIPADGYTEASLADIAQLASLIR